MCKTRQDKHLKTFVAIRSLVIGVLLLISGKILFLPQQSNIITYAQELTPTPPTSILPIPPTPAPAQATTTPIMVELNPTSDNQWQELIAPIVIAIFLSLLMFLLETLGFRQGLKRLFEYLQRTYVSTTNTSIEIAWNSFEYWANASNERISYFFATIKYTAIDLFVTVRIIFSFILEQTLLVLIFIRSRARQPKWYKDKGAIDPGMIEVSLAITALFAALPPFGIEGLDSLTMRIIRVFIEAIPIVVSIQLINLYAKDKGSKSAHVLIGIFQDGPFCFLSWAVIFGYFGIGILVLRITGN